MAVKTYSASRQGNTKLSANFKVSEFHSPGSNNDTVLVDDKLVTILQKIRNHFAKPVNITSAYRPESYNASVGGSSGSYHTKGQAADFYISGINVLDIAKYAESIGVLGIGCYKDDDFVHVDTRTVRFYWYNQTNTPTSSFGSTYPTIRYGSSSSYVRIAQSRLRELGLKDSNGNAIVTDGDFGEKTLFAVKSFQKKKKLDVDGVVGPDTWRALME